MHIAKRHSPVQVVVMEDIEKPRRDFLFLATGGVAALGGFALLRALTGPFRPSADITSLPSLIVDTSTIKEGEQLKVTWLARPVGIRHRTPDEIESAIAGNTVDLPDPETDKARLKPLLDGSYDPHYLVVELACPRFGCTVIAGSGDFNGWYCPCDSSHYDTSGRLRRGIGVKNLIVPDYEWISETKIRFYSRRTPSEFIKDLP